MDRVVDGKSDTNYEILGAVIERVVGKPIGAVFKEFSKPLHRVSG